MRILVVDDHEDSAQAVAMLLRRLGHEVTVAGSVSGALSHAAAGNVPDLLVCDITLPDGDGCALLARLCSSLGGRALPAIAITGHGREWEERCRAAGYCRMLTKPVDFAAVLEAVATIAPPAAD
jgi:CheY-like chemotaxis protein